MEKETDSIQKSIADYAHRLKYEDIPEQAVHAAKVRIIDTLGALIAGFFAEPSQIARNIAAKMPSPGATMIGTRSQTTVDMAAFVNATTARFPEMIDTYHAPGSSRGHASDTITPLLSVAEADRGSVLGRYVGGDASVLSGLLRGADEIKDRPFAIDVPGGFTGKGRVVLFANNPIYRWQTFGEHEMIFNAIMFWNDMNAAAAPKPSTAAQ